MNGVKFDSSYDHEPAEPFEFTARLRTSHQRLGSRRRGNEGRRKTKADHPVRFGLRAKRDIADHPCKSGIEIRRRARRSRIGKRFYPRAASRSAIAASAMSSASSLAGPRCMSSAFLQWIVSSRPRRSMRSTSFQRRALPPKVTPMIVDDEIERQRCGHPSSRQSEERKRDERGDEKWKIDSPV